MSILKDAIEKIADLATPKTYEIHGDTYTIDSNMRRVNPHIDRPAEISFSSLDGIAQAISAEIEREIRKPIFVYVESHESVRVFTTYRADNMGRDTLYSAAPDLPAPFRTWSDHDDAIIMLRSQFIQNEGTEYLLGLLSRISDKDEVFSEDNGVSQKVSATRGVALKTFEQIKSRVSLAPFRTFLEVDQPASEFIVRLKKAEGSPKIGIIEADGGAWKLAAKRNIAQYFREHLSKLIEKNLVVVAE